MDREIKFRVWEYRHQRTKGKGWQDSKFIWQMNYSPMLEGGETMCYGSSVDLNNALKNGGDEDDGIINPSIFMQYTGLKDKNGKEIYEGDILDYKTNYEPYKCVIEWDDDLCSCGCCYDEHHSVGFVGRVLPGSKYGYSSLAKNYEAMEIIGNIYENPELLKEVQDE